MSVDDILELLKSKGNPKTVAIYSRHGLPADRTFGVSNADLKTIAKTIKGQQELAYALYASGNVDAMYLAGIIVDGGKMSREQLRTWAIEASGLPMIAEYTVPWAALDNPLAQELALEWIHSDGEQIESSGWCTYSGIVATVPDYKLDLGEIESLLKMTVNHMSGAKNRVRANMNGFVISVGTYVLPLLSLAKETAERIGVIEVDMGDTACKVRMASEYIAKVEASGKLGNKRKTIRC